MVRRYGLFFLISAAGCNSGPTSGAPCPEAGGEFPPTGCAYVEGRLTAAGTPVAGAGLRVDAFAPPLGYAYLSDATVTDAMGRFGLVVLRINELQPPTVPDTATVHVKVYPTAADARTRAPTADSVSVLMRFAPMGTIVDTTHAELTLP
jgi:hypothetical protein